MASADLGELGETDGAPVLYDWDPPSPFPLLVPWLTVLVLLVRKPNRAAKAWWIWFPLLVLSGLEFAERAVLGFFPSEALDLFSLAFSSLAFGLVAVWLLADRLGHRLRFVVFLKTLGALAGVSGLAFLVRAEWTMPAEVLGILVFVAVLGFVAVSSLNLAGWVCRRRSTPVAVTLWTAAFTTALWFLIGSPFFVIAFLAGAGASDWPEFVQAILAFAGLTFAVLLPFLVLAFANSLYRERIEGLLHLGKASLAAQGDVPPVA